MHAFLSNVQQAPFHCICIAHSLEVRAEDGTTILVPQVGTRNFSDTVGKYFDHIVYCHIHNGQHKAGSSTLYRAGVLTGSRSDIAVESKDAKEVSLEGFFSTAVAGQYAVIKEETKTILQAAAIAITKPAEESEPIAAPVVSAEENSNSASPDPQQVTERVSAQPAEVVPAEPELSMAEKIKARLAAMKKN